MNKICSSLRRPLLSSVSSSFLRRPVPPVAPSIFKPFSTAPLFKTLGFQFQAPSFPPQFQQVRHFRKDRLWVQKKKRRKSRSRGATPPIVSKVKKYKIKGYSSFKSRFRARNDGTILRWRSGKAHNAHSKSKEAKRRLRKPALVHAAYATVMKKLNFCG